MRLFTAIDLTPELLLRLDRLLVAFRPEAIVNWSPLDNLHITTKFIGEWPEARLTELHNALSSLAPRQPFDITIQDLGWFPNDRSPRVLWAGIHAGQPLLDLVGDIETKLAELGIAKENRPFSPHLTLARIKSAVPLDRLRQKVEETQPAHLGSFPAAEFTLFRSEPGSNASIYRRLHVYKFESAFAAS